MARWLGFGTQQLLVGFEPATAKPATSRSQVRHRRAARRLHCHQTQQFILRWLVLLILSIMVSELVTYLCVQLLIFELHCTAHHVTLESEADLGEPVLHDLMLPWSARLQIYALRTLLSLGDWVWTVLRFLLWITVTVYGVRSTVKPYDTSEFSSKRGFQNAAVKRKLWDVAYTLAC